MNIKRILFIVLCVLLATILVLAGIALSKVGSLLGMNSTPAPTPTEPTSPTEVPTDPQNTEHVHSYTLTDTIQATCDGYGWNIYTCSSCKQTHMPVGERMDPLGHNYEVSQTMEATCTEGGFTELTCTRCNRKDVPADQQQAPLGHSWGHGKVYSATCETGGFAEFTCTRCNLVEKRDQVEPLGHQFEPMASLDATCTEDAYTISICTREGCGAEETVTEVGTATGHTAVVDNAVEATCTTDGYTGGTHCRDCNAVLTAGTVIPATNHSNTEIRNSKPATETEDGYTGDKYCKDCNTLLEKGSVIDKLFTIPSYDCQTSLEQSLLAEINAFRAENGVHALMFDKTVHEGAHIRVNEFIYRELNTVDVAPHNRLDGSSFDTVFEDIGLGKWPYGHCAENIAAASDSASLFSAWEQSTKGHREAMLEADFTHIGLCVVYNNGTYYAVAIFHNNAPPQVMN